MLGFGGGGGASSGLPECWGLGFRVRGMFRTKHGGQRGEGIYSAPS